MAHRSIYSCDHCGKTASCDPKRYPETLAALRFLSGHCVEEEYFDLCEECLKKLRIFLGCDPKTGRKPTLPFTLENV